MAFASVGTLGSVQNKTADKASAALTITAQADAGNLVVLWIAVDNNSSTSGGVDEAAITGVTDSAGGNTWVEAKEWTNSAGSAAQTGATVALWYSVLTNTISSGGTITVSWNNATSRDAAALSAWEFTKGAGTTIAIEGTPATFVGVSNNAIFDVTTANIECLRLVAFATESNSGNIAGDTDFTQIS